MRDYALFRRFGNTGMELFDLREHDLSLVLQAVPDKGTSKYQLIYDDHALKFLRAFVESREKENYYEVQPAGMWEFITDTCGLRCPEGKTSLCDLLLTRWPGWLPPSKFSCFRLAVKPISPRFVRQLLKQLTYAHPQ